MLTLEPSYALFERVARHMVAKHAAMISAVTPTPYSAPELFGAAVGWADCT